GLWPARYAARVDLHDSLKDGGRSGATRSSTIRFRGILMIAEIALALVLVVGAGLLPRSFARAVRVDTGVQHAGVVDGMIGLPSKRYPTGESRRLGMEEILRRVESVPGVSAAALSSALPLSGTMQNKITFEGHPHPTGKEPLVQIQLITPDYFRVM